jgi:hypothetical protein
MMNANLDTALRYFREAAPRHNGDEEESLFPRLWLLPDLEVGRALADLARLEQEHHRAAPLIVAQGKYALSIGGAQPGTDVPSVSGDFNVNGQVMLPE